MGGQCMALPYQVASRLVCVSGMVLSASICVCCVRCTNIDAFALVGLLAMHFLALRCFNVVTLWPSVLL